MKYTIFTLLIVFSGLSMTSCDQPGEKKETKVKQKSAPATPFEQSLAYHGGLSTWNNYGTLRFTRINNNDSITHLVDLKDRYEVIRTNDGTLGFNNEGLWTTSKNDQVIERLEKYRFQKNLWFYFFALPFVTADPGANQETIADGVSRGKTYSRVKITFGADVGDAPDDQYILWLDKESGKLELINYSVTYGRGKEAAEKYKAIVYSDWSDADGLIVPGKLTPHVWQGDTLGEPRGEYYFTDVRFAVDRPDISEFAPPGEAVFVKYED